MGRLTAAWKAFQGYTKPSMYAPQWYVGNLVFQGGNPRQRQGSMTGGGQIYGHELEGLFQPVIVPYATPVISPVAGGQINANPAFLQALFGGASGNGS